MILPYFKVHLEIDWTWVEAVLLWRDGIMWSCKVSLLFLLKYQEKTQSLKSSSALNVSNDCCLNIGVEGVYWRKQNVYRKTFMSFKTLQLIIHLKAVQLRL